MYGRGGRSGLVTHVPKLHPTIRVAHACSRTSIYLQRLQYYYRVAIIRELQPALPSNPNNQDASLHLTVAWQLQSGENGRVHRMGRAALAEALIVSGFQVPVGDTACGPCSCKRDVR